ncbi:MAG: sensor histidine kinase [Candidatus Omnitrophota bacterium]|jgi:PAS domain S-box-containing protein|nr:MAG: sensor histidine kinase [Candidatus Omnitrophota bacterium]
MKRLRGRMIVAFWGLVLLATIPLSVIPYFALHYRHQVIRSQQLEETNVEIEKDIKLIGNELQRVLHRAALFMQDHFPKKQALVEKLESSTDPEDFVLWKDYEIWPRFFGEPFSRALNSDEDLRIIPKQLFLEMKSWLEKKQFYEDEQGRIYLYCFETLWKGKNREEMEIVGGLFVKFTLIEKRPGQTPIFRIQKSYDAIHTVIDPSPGHLKSFLPKDAYTRLYDFDEDGIYEEVDVDDVVLQNIAGWENVRVQAKCKPVINHRGELAAVMIMAIPIVDMWEISGMFTIWGIIVTLLISLAAAVLMARFISKPINELAQAASYMSKGDFDVRVRVSGTEEQRVLSSTFNQLADQVKDQLVQLHRQTQELEESNRELNQTHRFLQNILAHIHTGVMSLDIEGRLSHVNRVGLEILQINELQGRKIEDAIESSSFVKVIRYSLQNVRSLFEEEVLYQTKDGDLIPLQVSTVPLMENGALTGLVVTFHDLSSIRKLEEQLRRQDRLAALGRMAAGVAHEIRNPLGIIRGSAELLRKRFGELPNEDGLSDFIIEEVNRLSRVVNDFLMFARPPLPSLEEMSVSSLFETILAYVKSQPGTEQYRIVEEIEPDLPPIAVDANLFRQAFLNLWLNAQQAMPDGGTITIRAQKMNHKELAIEIADEGIGISPDHLDRIFDPFYTSKDNGTGLGLSLVHQIIDSHHGRVEVESIPKRGSRFRLIFPTAAMRSFAASGELL